MSAIGPRCGMQARRFERPRRAAGTMVGGLMASLLTLTVSPVPAQQAAPGSDPAVSGNEQPSTSGPPVGRPLDPDSAAVVPGAAGESPDPRKAAAAPAPSVEAQTTVLTVRDASGTKDQPIPLSIEVQRAPSDRTVPSLYMSGLPNGARLRDGSHEVSVMPGQDLVDITGWDLPNLTVTMPSGTTGALPLSVIAISTPADGGRPLLTEAALMVQVDGASVPSGAVRTVQADVKQDQIAVRATAAPEGEQGRSETPTASAAEPAQTASVPDRGTQEQPAPVGRDPVAEALAAERGAALERERSRTEALTRELAQAREEVGELKSKLAAGASEPAAGAGAPNAPRSEPSPPPVGRSQATPETKEAGPGRLLSRAEGLLRQGDISGARRVLERAVAEGSAVAAFLLAQTYDPRLLRTWNVRGIAPDIDKARELYDRAAEAGLNRAREMAEAMH